MISPDSVLWETGELNRVERAQLALLLHKTPQEIDLMPLKDVQDVLAVRGANQRIEADRMKNKRGGR